MKKSMQFSPGMLISFGIGAGVSIGLNYGNMALGIGIAIPVVFLVAIAARAIFNGKVSEATPAQ